jgi:glycosyltransferase involved in cell wall biosynthesis
LPLSVIIPTHAPHPGRLRRTLAGLKAQTLPASAWELLIVDNASPREVDLSDHAGHAPVQARVVREPQLGLTWARRRGFADARGEYVVLVDDDNVLAPDYLANVLARFGAHPRVGAMGGRCIPEFEATPAPWVREFDGLLACRDLGEAEMISTGLRNPRTGRNEYPLFAPVGAGMALRKAAVQRWLADSASSLLPDRRGRELTSGGDNDIILTMLQHDWEVAYFPELMLQHLIPAGRTDRSYLARLNRGIASSWMQVLSRHDANPWPALPGWSIPFRQAKAWFSHRAWAGPAEYVRWQGACGHFAGRRK